MAKCSAKSRRTGAQCGAPAIAGGTVCYHHGGAAGQTKAAAARRLAQAELEALVSASAPPIAVEPHRAILAMIAAAAGRVAFWQAFVDDLDAGELVWGVTRVKDGGDDRGQTQEAKPHVAYSMLTAESDRLVRYSEVALKAGIEERRVQLAERDGQRVVRILTGFVDRLGLSGDERARTVLGEVVREVLAIEGGVA